MYQNLIRKQYFQFVRSRFQSTYCRSRYFTGKLVSKEEEIITQNRSLLLMKREPIEERPNELDQTKESKRMKFNGYSDEELRNTIGPLNYRILSSGAVQNLLTALNSKKNVNDPKSRSELLKSAAFNSFMKNDTSYHTEFIQFIREFPTLIIEKPAPVLRRLAACNAQICLDSYYELIRTQPQVKRDPSVNTIILRAYRDLGEFENCRKHWDMMRAQGYEIRERDFVTVLTSLQASCRTLEELKIIYELTLDMKNTLLTPPNCSYASDKSYMPALNACTAMLDRFRKEDDRKIIHEYFLNTLNEAFEEAIYPCQEFRKCVCEYFEKFGDGYQINYDHKIHESGKCECCGENLLDITLKDRTYESLEEGLDKMVGTTHWKRFKEFLSNKKIDCVIDMANVAYFSQSSAAHPTFQHFQADYVYNHLTMQGYKCLMVLSARHIHNAKGFNKTITDRWEKSGDLWIVSPGVNDDLFWLYAAVHNKPKCVVVTNDLCRDHQFNLLNNRDFVKWRERHTAHFTFIRDNSRKTVENLQIGLAPAYSRRAQIVNESVHMPINIRDPTFEDPGLAWFCISRKKSSE